MGVGVYVWARQPCTAGHTFYRIATGTISTLAPLYPLSRPCAFASHTALLCYYISPPPLPQLTLSLERARSLFSPSLFLPLLHTPLSYTLALPPPSPCAPHTAHRMLTFGSSC